MRRFGQGGFATLEVILMVTVLGILAAIAVPRFTDVTTRANTAKIQSDLTAIDTAIELYKLKEGTAPTSMTALNGYLNDADKLEPPTGKCYLSSSTAKDIPSGGYRIEAGRAKLGDHTAGDFIYKESSGSSGSGG